MFPKIRRLKYLSIFEFTPFSVQSQISHYIKNRRQKRVKFQQQVNAVKKGVNFYYYFNLVRVLRLSPFFYAGREMAQDWIGYALATDSLWIGVLTPNQSKCSAKPLQNQSCAPSLVSSVQQTFPDFIVYCGFLHPILSYTVVVYCDQSHFKVAER